jgi:NTE family protein
MGIKEVFSRFQKQVEFKVQHGTYRNLVFKGGGVRGIAYIGAMQVLEELGILKNIMRLAGTSAGAIAAMITSFRLSVDDTIKVFNTLDFEKIPQSRAMNSNPRFLQIKDNESYKRLFEKYGWYSSEYFHTWLEDTIAGFCDGNRRATFEDFQSFGHRDLYIVAANLSRHRSEVFSAKATPKVAVADAVRMSMSIPLFFEALRFDGQAFGNGDYYVDGGVYDNYPVHIFDEQEYSHSSLAYRKGVNWETLGLYLYPEKLLAEDKPDIPKNLFEFVLLTGRNLYDSHDKSSLLNDAIETRRSIEISDCGISAVDFDIEPEGEKYNKLFKSGQDAARKFFNLE